MNWRNLPPETFAAISEMLVAAIVVLAMGLILLGAAHKYRAELGPAACPRVEVPALPFGAPKP